MVLILFMLILGFYQFMFNKLEYHSLVGQVQDIKMGFYLHKRTSTFEIEKRFVKKSGIEIGINNSLFYIDNNEKDKWSKILQKVRKGDTIRIFYYHFQDRNLNNIHGLETKTDKIMTVEERNAPLKYLVGSMILFFVLSSIFLTTLMIRRKQFLSKS